MNLERQIEERVLKILGDYPKDKIPLKEAIRVIALRFRIDKFIIRGILKDLDEGKRIEVNQHYVILKHDRLSLQKHQKQ